MKKVLRKKTLETIYAISKVASNSILTKLAYDEICNLLLDVFHFNYFLIHQLDSQRNPHIIYAKSFRAENIQNDQDSWEEILANIVIDSENVILQQIEQDIDELTQQESIRFLGIPLVCGKKCRGSVAFIRLGNSPFTPDEINLAEFTAQQISIIMERELIRLEEEIIDNQRNQARLQEDFISQITHDLRNPLGVIKGYSTTLMRTDIKWNPEIRMEFLKIIDQETDRLQSMIDNLLDSARLQSGQFEMQFQIISIEPVVDNVISRAINLYPNLKFHLDKGKNLNPIYGDPRRLTQVFENLISNVDKHAPGADIWIKIDNNNGGLKILFIDNGPGVSEEYLPKLFTRFFRVPQNAPNVHGSGLGLYICKQIIENHRGRISAASAQGNGMTIQIDLPGKLE